MADDSTNGTMEEHLEDIASPGTRRTLRRVRRANQSSSANPPTGLELWANAEEAITSRHQQPQQQQTREQRASAAEQELVAASLRRAHEAEANNRSVFNDDTGIDDAIDSLGSLSVMNDGDDIGTFNCDIIDYRFRWRIRRMQDHYITTPLSSPPSYRYGLRIGIGSSKPSPAQ